MRGLNKPALVRMGELLMNGEQYIPGECNIGSTEIARRKRAGWIGLMATVGLGTTFILLEVDPAWRTTLFLPATMAR